MFRLLFQARIFQLNLIQNTYRFLISFIYVISCMQRLSLISEHVSKQTNKPLSGKTVVITGASRGIGLAIGLRCAKDGANVAILAKTTTPQPTLQGTIYTAAEQINKAGGKALPLVCDIRNEQNVKQCIQKVVDTFGGIDILINNASAINLVGVLDQSMKKYDLMHQINTRGTFIVSKQTLPHLLKAKNPHILNLSPPLNMHPKWFGNHLAYTMAKYGMSMCVLGMAQEFKSQGVAVNALWPKTAIATAAVKNILGGDQSIRLSRNVDIMSDSAYLILTSNSRQNTGNFYIDEQILKKHGINDFTKYRTDPKAKQEELLLDFFVE